MRLLFSLIFSFIIIATPGFAADDDYGVSSNEQLTESVTILSVSSLTIPISELALAYSRKNNFDVNTVFESAGELLRQVDNGEPADIIIFSNDEWIKNVKDRGLIDPNSVTIIAKNNLQLVAAKQAAIPTNMNLPDALDYIHNRMLMVISNPADTNLGRSSKAMLISNNKWDKFEKMIVLAPNSTKAADLIIKSQTAGVIYATDYSLYQKDLDLVSNIPANLHQPIIYKGGLVIGKNMKESRKFLKFLTSEEAKNIFKKYGFIVE